MSGDLAVSLALKLNDQGSGPATQALNKIKQGMKEVGEAAKSSSAAAVSAFQKLATSREILGIRSEKAIQNEIRQTEAAYQRMVSAGISSARELGRAQDAMRGKVAALRQEMEGAHKSSMGMGGAFRTAVGIVGAGQAGRMMLQGPVSKTMDYSMELAHTSNVMFAGQAVAARIAGKGKINNAVMAGVREAKGGVTREDSLAGLQALSNSGEFGNDPGTAMAMLPHLTKAAAANNASVTDMANIAIKAKANLGLTNTSRVLDMAAQGGIEGQFELRHMAKWLPQQMAYAQRTGLRGESGFATLVAANQVAMNTAGSTDEAGNNVKNLLSKVNSTDTANDAKKLGIDLSGSLAAAQKKGVGGLDAFLNLTESVAAKDPRLVKLRKEAEGAKGEDLRANLKAQQGILEGSAIGKLVQDQQAMAALVALLQGRGKFNDIRDKALGANGTNEDLLKVIADEAGAKAQLAAAEAANNMQTALNNVNPLIGLAADGFSRLSQEFPTLATALTGATLGVTTLGAMALAAAVPMALLGGGSGVAAGAVTALGGAVGTAAAVIAAAIAPLLAMGGVAMWADSTNEPGEAEKVVDRMQNSPLSQFLNALGLNRTGDIEARRAQNREGLDTTGQTQEVKVVVDVKNGNIVAAVDEAQKRTASRH